MGLKVDRRKCRVDASGTALPAKFIGPRISTNARPSDTIRSPLFQLNPGLYRLYEAMLLLALKDLRHAAYHAKIRPLAQFSNGQGAQIWVLGNELPVEHPMSFESVCCGLGLIPEAVRYQAKREGLLLPYRANLAVMDCNGVVRVFKPGIKPCRKVQRGRLLVLPAPVPPSVAA